MHVRCTVAVIEICVLQLTGTEVGETESAGAPADQQLEPSVTQPCGRQPTDNVDSVRTSTLGRTDSTTADAEARWLARYPSLDRQQLAELREAFLVFAVDAIGMNIND